MNDNIMSQEEIEAMLKGAGHIDADNAGAEVPAEEAVAEAPAEEVAEVPAEEATEVPAEEPVASADEAVETPVEESAEEAVEAPAEENAETPAEETEANAPSGESSGGVEIPPLPTADYLSKEEEDVLGEIANICMGTSATTMSTLLGRKVDITIPKVRIHTPKSLASKYKAPMVIADVDYTQGVMGKNLLILDEYDVALMTDVLMGGDGSSVDPENIELDEMHMSAIREVMNQMVGSSATSLANIIGETVDISTPSAHHIHLNEEDITNLFAPEDILVMINFNMDIENLLNSKIMQLLPLNFAKQEAEKLLGTQGRGNGAEESPSESVASVAAPAPAADAPAVESVAETVSSPAPAPAPVATSNSAAMGTVPPTGVASGNIRSGAEASDVEYPNFDAIVGPGYAPVSENIALLSNVPMKVTVQLGKTKKKIKEILDFNNGSVIVLDKLAGEPVDVLVNGKHIAKGEVVVVDDSYGVRITEIDAAMMGDQL